MKIFSSHNLQYTVATYSNVAQFHDSLNMRHIPPALRNEFRNHSNMDQAPFLYLSLNIMGIDNTNTVITILYNCFPQFIMSFLRLRTMYLFKSEVSPVRH